MTWKFYFFADQKSKHNLESDRNLEMFLSIKICGNNKLVDMKQTLKGLIKTIYEKKEKA